MDFDAHVLQHEYDQAERYAQEVLQYEETGHVPFGMYLLGTVATLKREFAMAESYLQEAMQLSQAIEDRFIEARVWRSLTTLFYQTERYDDANEALSQAFKLYKQLGLPKELERTNQLAQRYNLQQLVG